MTSKILFKTLKIIAKVVIGFFLLYAVIFSIAGTITIWYAYNSVIKPIRQVHYLVNHTPKETAFMTAYRNSLKKHGKPGTFVHCFVPFDSISKNLKNAVLAAEDDGFYTHPGFDIEAILKAMKYNREQNKIARGASTLTQQLAKNLFLTNQRSFSRKFMEMGYTVLLEKYLDKDRIFELYLNFAQWGDSIFGCEAASRYYYGKSCSKLNLNEAARLAAILAMPGKLNPNNVESNFIQKRMEVIANNLYLHHVLNESTYTDLAGHQLPDSMIKPPDTSKTDPPGKKPGGKNNGTKKTEEKKKGWW